MGWILTSKCRSHEGVHWDITAGPVVLGHHAGRDIVVNDPRVDQQHCKLYTRAGRVYIESIGPGEHVHVNGAPVRVAALAPGDTIALGGARFTVTRNANGQRKAQGGQSAQLPQDGPVHNAHNVQPDPQLSTVNGQLSTAAPLATEAKGYATAIQNTARNPLSTVNCQLSTATPLLGDSRAMREARALIHQIAPTHLGVLITGETGTGKELAAEMLHAASRRAGGPLIAVNCAAIPENLFESEIFGHEKGAFTGADRKRRGKFELAHQGTLFLDEIGELTPENQARLLRVLERGAYHPVGAEKESHADVRILAATNRNLQQAIHEGRFRQDLFYRLGAVEITLPPLRMRPSDIPLLAQFFSNQTAQKLGTAAKIITDEALVKLQEYPWPGNVRELKNCVERAAALSRGEQIEAGDIELSTVNGQLPTGISPFTLHTSLNAKLSEVERQHIVKVLETCGFNVSAAARRLGVHRNTLHNKIAAYGIGG